MCFALILLLHYNAPLSGIQHPILSYQEYQKKEHALPYRFQLSTAQQSLFYFGANHSFDPNNEQYGSLDAYWQEFIDKTGGKNCVVLVEGSLRKLYESTTTTEAIRRGGGEGGFITFRAQEKNIPIECPEPTKSLLKEKLLESFTQDEVDYRDFSLCVQTFHRRRCTDPHLVFETFYQRFTNVPSLSHMKNVHMTLFNTAFDAQDEDFYYSITNPADDATIINAVCRTASMIRDQHVVTHIEALLKEKKNVFVVYGATHAVMQEYALTQIVHDKSCAHASDSSTSTS